MLARIRLSVSRLVDGLGGPALSNAALLIEGDRIAEVGVEASVPRPEDCLQLTFLDATALPGLIDAHVHLTVSWEATRGDAIARGVILGPRLLVSGRPLTPTGGHCFWMGGEVDGSDAIRAAVRQLVEEGADGIKVMAT